MRDAALLASVLLVSGTPAAAHGLRLTVTAQAGCISGQVAYSDGWPGEGETAVVSRADDATRPVRVVADAAGRFVTRAAPGRHRVKVSGDEEHEVEREIDVPIGQNATCGTEAARPAGPERP